MVGKFRRKAHTKLWQLKLYLGMRRARRAVARFPQSRPTPHGLKAALVVSLTSHPPRYGTLSRTLKSLLDQDVRPDHVMLWVAAPDFVALPEDVLALRQHGLSIDTCPDLKSYNKIIPTLRRWPDAYIVTADDDLYYPPDWLRTLIDGYRAGPPAICAHRMLRITYEPDGSMRPYREWEWDAIEPEDAPPAEHGLFPTGVGGVLYPPHALAPEVIDAETMMALAPHEDDLWLYWMGRRAGARYRQVGRGFDQLLWEGTQETALFTRNNAGGSDAQIEALVAHFGKV
jgi:Glycosyl transferase family 2